MRVDDLVVSGHDLAHLIGDRPHLHRVGSDDPELHRESDRRAEHETVNPRARLCQGAVGERAFEPRLDTLPGCEVLGDDDNLREVWVWKYRVEPEPETRRALAHIGGVGLDVWIASEQLFGAFGDRVGDADGGAFRKPHLEEQFGPR